jgi:hypothetical protein
MTNLNFRLPAIRTDSLVRSNVAMLRASPRSPAAAHTARRRVMNADGAALIALRRLDAEADGQGCAVDCESDQDQVACSNWFDSTWELSRGLDICEGPPADLALEGWLALYLARDKPVGTVSVEAIAA